MNAATITPMAMTATLALPSLRPTNPFTTAPNRGSTMMSHSEDCAAARSPMDGNIEWVEGLPCREGGGNKVVPLDFSTRGSPHAEADRPAKPCYAHPMTPDNSAVDPAEEVRKIPKADRLLACAEAAGLVARLGHGPVMEAVRAELDVIRGRIRAGGACPPISDIEGMLLARLGASARGSLRRVVNATGVVIHTNLGRAPLSDDALAAMRE